MSSDKIISRDDFSALREKLRDEGKKVVLCHGVFDLLHYGHIEHLREAKEQGDVLVVSVTAAKYVNKGPGRPYFNDEQRLSFLAGLEMVDYVMLSNSVTVHDVVKSVRPDFYVKGQEYAIAENDVTGNIGAEERIVKKYGGKIYFTQGEVYSSTRLLNIFFGALPEDVLDMSKDLIAHYGDSISEELCKQINAFSDCKVLVIGDVIIDDYIFCRVQGLTSKDSMMSTAYEKRDRYAGGALAIARHLADFAGKVKLLSMMGKEIGLREFLEEIMYPVDLELLENERFVTPVKTRYLKHNDKRDEYDKLFSVNRLLTTKARQEVDYSVFYERTEKLLNEYDIVIICDYGHGLINKKTIDILERKAKFLAVNCQTNSSNIGKNIITKYPRADAFVVDERELSFACACDASETETFLPSLQEKLQADYAWVTLGAKGALGIRDNKKAIMPAVTLRVKDTVGAGDAFYALAALCAYKKMPIDTATLVANIAGAIKTNKIGNSEPVRKVDLLKFLKTVLNV